MSTKATNAIATNPNATTTSSNVSITNGNNSNANSNNKNAIQTNDRIEWSRTIILNFIEDYRRQRVLWDPNTKGYHIKQTKYEALKILSNKYGTEIRSIRSKIKSLRSSFHREHGKVMNNRRKGVHYQPMWFAYEAIHFILDGETHSQQEQQTSKHTSTPITRRERNGKDDNILSISTTSNSNVKTEDKFSNFVRRVMVFGNNTDAGSNNNNGGGISSDRGDTINEYDLLLMDNSFKTSNKNNINANNNIIINNNNDNNKTSKNNYNKNINGECLMMGESKKIEHEMQEKELENQLKFESFKIVATTISTSITPTTTTQPLALNDTKTTTILMADTNTNAAYIDDNKIVTRIPVNIAGSVSNVSVASVACIPPLTTTTTATTNPLKSVTLDRNMDEFAVTRSDFDGDSQNYCCNISADDVKTEIIESDAMDLGVMDRMIFNSTPYPSFPTNKRQSNETITTNPAAITTTISNRKRKFNAEQMEQFCRKDDMPTSSKKNKHQQHQQHQQHHEQQQQQQQQHFNTQYKESDQSQECTTLNVSTSPFYSNYKQTPTSSMATTAKPTTTNQIDEYGVFGEYVAITIRKLKTSKAKIVIKHLINNLLYEAELGKYDYGIPSSNEPPQLYKM